MQRAPSPSFLERPLARAAIAAVLLAALAGVFLAVRARDGDGGSGATLEGQPTRTSGAATAEAGIGPLDNQRPIKGSPAPDFALRDLDGNVVKLSDLRGQVVWLNFWATWCTPCKKELPDIQKLYDEMRDRGLVVLAINKEESAGDAGSFMASRDLSLPVLLDSDGAVYTQYRLQGLPDSFFIDRDGNIAAIYFGFLNEQKMRDRLAEAGLP